MPYRSTGNDIPPSPKAYADVVRETLGGLGLKIVLEPGRVIVANAGVLVARVHLRQAAAATRSSRSSTPP